MVRLNGLGKPLLAGLLLREFLAPWTGHPFDFEVWVRLGVFIQSGASPYSLLTYIPNISFAPYPVMTSISYPPLPAFIFGLTYRLYEALGSPSPFLYYFLLKQPMIVSDLLVAVLLFRLLSLKGEGENARRVALLWIALPFGIIVSTLWGALDPFALALILGALYADEVNRPYASATFLGLAIFLKLMPVIFLPLFIIKPGLSIARRASFAAIALAIPLVGTLAPLEVLGWGYSGLYSAVSYQGSLPAFGGMGVFNVLSLLRFTQTTLTQALILVWLPGLILAYAYAYRRKSDLYEGSLITVLAFSILRPSLPEQWALYPIAFLLLLPGKDNRTHAWALLLAATAFLLANNLLLVRFFSPISIAAFNWDQMLDSASVISPVRDALLLVFSTLFSAESITVILGRPSFLAAKLESIKRVKLREALVPVGYVGVVTVVGGVLDFTATKMVTDWALAIQSHVFLGLSWLSLYHLMLVLVFESMAILIVAFARGNASESVGLFLLLTSLNFVAGSLSLVLYRALDGTPLLASTTIFLVSSVYISELSFVVFAITLGLMGVFYLDEMRSLILTLARGIARTNSKSAAGQKNANSLPAPP